MLTQTEAAAMNIFFFQGYHFFPTKGAFFQIPSFSPIDISKLWVVMKRAAAFRVSPVY